MKFLEFFSKKAMSVPAVSQIPAQSENTNQSNVPIAENYIQSFYKKFNGSTTYTSEALLGMDTGWVKIATDKIATSISVVPYYLLLTLKKGQKKADWLETKNINKRKVQHLTSYLESKALGSEQEVLNHPVLDLLADVNPYMTFIDLLQIISKYLDLLGNCFIYPEKDGSGKVVALWPLLSEYCTITVQNGRITEVKQQNAGIPSQTFKYEDLIHFKYLTAGHFTLGIGPLSSVIIDAERMKAYNQFECALASNSGRPDYIIKYTGSSKNGVAKLDEKSKSELEKVMAQKYGGQGQGKVLVTDGTFELITLGFTPREMQFLEGRKDAQNIICGALGVPLTFFNTENVNRSNMESALYAFQRFTIEPRLRYISRVFTEYFIKKEFDENLHLVFDSSVEISQTEKIALFTFLVTNNVITIDEARAEFGFDINQSKGAE